ncbi:MAG TPA: permease [Gemmatimonadaceae bacterium]|nr:permease [Gemmatimonadaceae bacterium]
MTLTPELQAAAAGGDERQSRRAVAAGLALLALFLAGLFYYKWGGSVRTIAAVWSSAAWTRPADGLTRSAPLAAVGYYFARIWIALVYGLLIGAAVCAFVPPQRMARLLSRGGALRRQIVAAGTGAPLMLCSCCITPVFSAVYESGARLGSALTVMLASPALNPAALILTFVLFPLGVASTRLVGAVVAVLLLPVLLERMAGPGRVLSSAALPTPGAGGAVGGPSTLRAFLARFARSLGHVSAVTIPLIVVGVFASSLVLRANANLAPANTLVGVLITATVAVPLTLPTFFELPIALVAFAAGAPALAVVILFAGPIVNLPSLLIVAREAKPRTSLALALGVWVLAVGAGVVML